MDAITPHRCEECDEVRDRLSRHEPRRVPESDMKWLGDSLPLLSPEALRYYLPRYLEFSITHRDSNACEFVLYHLSSEHPEEEYWAERYAVFSQEERDALVEYLRYRSGWAGAELEQAWVLRAIRFWSAQQAHARDVRNARA